MVVQGANAWVFLRQWTLGAGLVKTPKRHQSPPAFVSRSVYALGSLLLLSNLGAVFDIWFHVTSKPSVFSTNTPASKYGGMMLGKEINETRCASYLSSAEFDNTTRELCGMSAATGAVFTQAVAEAQRTWAGTSTSSRVAMTLDTEETAILVPHLIPANSSYIANTLGVYSTCARSVKRIVRQAIVLILFCSVTRHCISLSAESETYWTTHMKPELHCKGYPRVDFNNTDLGGHGGIIIRSPWGVVNTTTGHVTNGVTTFAHESIRSKLVLVQYH